VTTPALSFPHQLPQFETLDEERRYRKEHLAAAFRIWARLGYDEGPAGHITVRDPERLDHFWVNPFGLHFALLRVCDLLLVDHTGAVVEGRWPVNRAAFCIHAAIHRARPDVVAAAHCHSVHGKAWSSLGRPLDPLTQDACAFYEDHALFDDYTGVVVEEAEGQRIAAALGSNKAAILRNHGLLTVGASVDAAAWFFIAMDRSCHAQLLAEAAGRPVAIDHPNAKLTHSQIGTELAGWFSFQPMYDWIVRQEPDLLD
jgi:ribulose-5-phosphate 4-epimerase/fuculose-1-phosphate aldolase